MGAESGLRRRVKGLSEAEFRARFGSEAQCREALFALRWGQGWACPGCGHGGYAELKGRAGRCRRAGCRAGRTRVPGRIVPGLVEKAAPAQHEAFAKNGSPLTEWV